jgi:hypothetical protein
MRLLAHVPVLLGVSWEGIQYGVLVHGVLPFEVLLLCKYVDREFALCHYDPSLRRHADNDIS